MTRSRTALLCSFLLAPWHPALHAQTLLPTSDPAPAPAASEPPQCHGEMISRIEIHTNPPFVNGGPRFARRLTKIATDLHATTRPSVIRRYLTLQVGQPCNEFRRRESERILRAQPYIADASVIAIPDSLGGVVLDVTTVDEVSIVIDGNVSTHPLLRSLRFGETNFGGQGVYAVAGWQNSLYRRDVYKARVVDYQFLGRPYQFGIQGVRNEIGGSWDIELSHPFLTNLQRISWRATAGSSDGYAYFVRPNVDDPALRFVRTYADIGGVRAFGSQRRLVLLGTSISRERERSAFAPVVVTDSTINPDTNSPFLVGRFGDHQATRLNLLLGLRNISFLEVSSFDALLGSQDIRNGIQVSGLLGKGLKTDDRDEPDYFLSGDIYAGHGNQTTFTAIELMGERRRNMDTHDWDGILASGRAAWYRRYDSKNTMIADLEWSGGWRQRVPFQLRFSDRDGGLRGYASSDLAGGQRLVARVENRTQLRTIRQFAAIGGAIFLDAGEIWAGDSPYGTNTGIKASAGIGLIAAVPPRSRRAWRIDLAVPINDRGDTKSLELRFTNLDATRWFWREPGDVQMGRERSIPNSVYNWP
jgi:hypothetical protein